MEINNLEFEKQNLQDEQFCQSFELKALADLLIRKETERWVSGFANVIVQEEHESRYKWITKFVRNKRVLDIACGSGKGSFTIAQEGNAIEVVGCDLDSTAIKYAAIRYKHPKVTFLSHDAQTYKDSRKYDVIVSFETIEHLPDVNAFLSGVSDLLAPNGTFYVSTPISKKGLDTNPENPYHVQEWGLKEFNGLISKYFTVEETYLQMREENYPLIYYWIKFKQKFQYIFKRGAILNFKEKYLYENAMKPIKYNHNDNTRYKNYYGIIGLQILIVKKKK